MGWVVPGKGALGPELKGRAFTLTFTYVVTTGELLAHECLQAIP